MSATYGYCPVCGATGVQRERRPNGNDTCLNGHVYPAASALSQGEFTPAPTQHPAFLSGSPTEPSSPLAPTMSDVLQESSRLKTENAQLKGLLNEFMALITSDPKFHDIIDKIQKGAAQ